jgi:two-component system LytT family sensor kinase
MSRVKSYIPYYTSKDYLVMGWTIIPYTILTNGILFGSRYFTDWKVLVPATLLLLSVMTAFYLVCGTWAVWLRNRFPEDKFVKKRLALAIATFMLMSAVVLSFLLQGYEYFDVLDYRFQENDFTWAFSCLAILNIFITFLHEYISRFEHYKTITQETEALKREYMKSQLLGLKSQVNPHFLFNSLNTLSSLIQENPEKAESFLDEMSKVYRYLLRGSDEHLVTLETELSFIQSYYFLLKSRYGKALHLTINVPPDQLERKIPPLTLQMIFENVLNQNRMSKEHPLVAHVTALGQKLCVQHNIQPKLGSDLYDQSGLQNIVNKFRLLGNHEVTIHSTVKERIICLPLLKEEAGVRSEGVGIGM